MTVLLPAFLADANWFLVALSLPVGALTALLHPTWRAFLPPALSGARHGDTRLYVIWALVGFAALLGVLGVALELYHSRGCPNTAVFHYEIENLARFVYELCEREQLPYWTAFGNLLFVMRRQRRIPVGDTDSDIGVPKDAFLERFGSVANFSRLVRREAFMELQRPTFVVYHDDRELLQIYLDETHTGSHADIWLYRDEVDAATGTRWLVNEDRTVRGKRLPYDQVLPLQDEPAFFLNVPVRVPHNASYLAQAEYGASFMTPLTMRMECIENVLNGYAFYKTSLATRLRFAACLALLTTALALVLANGVPPLRRAIRLATGVAHAHSHADDDRFWLGAKDKSLV